MIDRAHAESPPAQESATYGGADPAPGPNTTSASPRDAEALLELSAARLDALFQNSAPGEIPAANTRGTILLSPGSPIAKPAARVLGALFWRGKRFRALVSRRQRRPGGRATDELHNLVGPLGLPAIRAEVYRDASWLDGRPCIVLDYSSSSRVASWIRDEIREISPGLHLGLVWGTGRLFNGRRLVLRFALSRSDESIR